MDISDRVQYLKEHRHKDAEQLWRGFSDKFQLPVSSNWFDSIAKCLDVLEKDLEHALWAGEMKVMLRSERCENWRAQYLQPRRSRLHGILQRTTTQESAGAIVNAQNMIKRARHVLTNNVQEELAGLTASNALSATAAAENEASSSQDMANEANEDAEGNTINRSKDAHNRQFVLPVDRAMHSRIQHRLFRYTIQQLSAFGTLSKLKQKDV
ncbi:hypothetical protein BGZ82_002609 [Podila clonocystis]|nr:hypothetical protein BGZ82_002609 [Podila clonocystis]